MPGILIDRVSMAYGSNAPVLVDVELAVREREFLVVIGPSGSGKTTLLRIVAGLERQGSGHIYIDDALMDDVPSKRRGVAFLAQESTLYPHLSVRRNISFPLDLGDDDAESVATKVADIARDLRITSQLDRSPAALSAGERHAVATGRAVVAERPVVLMDEPFTNVDARARQRVRGELRKLKQVGSATVILATNDQDIAMAMGDRIAVLSAGRLQQVGTPRQVYFAPANVFVAGFVGTMNLMLGVLHLDGSPRLSIGSRTLDIPSDLLDAHPGLLRHDRQEVVVGIRPESLRYGSGGDAPGTEQRLGGEIIDTEFLGNETIVHVASDAVAPDRSPGVELLALIPSSAQLVRGNHLALAVDVGRILLFDPADGSLIGP